MPTRPPRPGPGGPPPIRAGPDAGHRSAERAATLLAGCQGAHTPLLDLDGLGAVLTPRERQIATLAAELSSREIAGRLGVSVRTIGNHLARIYQKLGITSRAELRSIIR